MSDLDKEPTNGGSRKKYMLVGGDMFLDEKQQSITMPPQNSKKAVLGNDFMTIPLEPDREEEMEK